MLVSCKNSSFTSGLFLKYFGTHTAKRFIANISSGAATTPCFGWPLYCASKPGMEAFTRSVALEQAEAANPVIAIIISPGVINTEMQEMIRSQDVERFKELKRFQQLKSEDNLQPPRKVAEAILAIMESSPESGETFIFSRKRFRQSFVRHRHVMAENHPYECVF